MKKENNIQLFEQKQVRTHWDEEHEDHEDHKLPNFPQPNPRPKNLLH